MPQSSKFGFELEFGSREYSKVVDFFVFSHIRGLFWLGKGLLVPRMVRKLAPQRLEIGERLL